MFIRRVRKIKKKKKKKEASSFVMYVRPSLRQHGTIRIPLDGLL